MAKKSEKEIIKRSLTEEEWRIVAGLWLKGDSADSICKKFPKTNISPTRIKTRMRKDGVTWRRQNINSEVAERLSNEMVDEKVEFTKRVVKLYSNCLDVIETITQQYKDEQMLNPGKPRATAYNCDMLAAAINKCQNGTRVALGMDKDGNLIEKEPEVLTIEGLDVDKI